MRRLLENFVGKGNTTTKCPILTEPTDNDDNLGCEYTDWAYALFAVVALIIVGIPFVIFICYVHRKVQNKKRARGLTRSISHDDSSNHYPYQPLHRDGSGHANYGATDNSSIDEHSVRSPSHASIGSNFDRLSQQPDTTSVASSRASVIPTYDEVSLSHRNALLASKSQHPSNSETKRVGDRKSARKKNERRSSHLSTDSQEKGVDQPGQFYESVDVVSNVPKFSKQAVPKNQNQPPPKPPRQFIEEDNTAVTEEPVYSVLESPKPDDVSPPPTNDVTVPEMDALSATPEAKPSAEAAVTPESGNEDFHEYAEVPDKDEEQRLYNEGEKRDSPPSEEKHSLLHDEKPLDDTVTDGPALNTPPGEKYLTVLPPTPPKQMSEPISEETASLESSGPQNFDQYSVSPKDETSKSRTDFEEFLLDKVRALSANERNGTFLIRDSISSTGSKVLTMYCWKADSNKELYNFKICVTEDGQAFLHRSSAKFSDLNGLLEYLREHKDMLPCVLATQVFP